MSGLGGECSTILEEVGSAPRGLLLPPGCAQRHRPEATTAAQAGPPSLRGSVVWPWGLHPSPSTPVSPPGTPRCPREDLGVVGGWIPPGGLHPGPRPPSAPCPALRNVHRPWAERRRKAAAPVLGARRAVSRGRPSVAEALRAHASVICLHPWRREWQPIPVFFPGEFHGQRSLAGYSP